MLFTDYYKAQSTSVPEGNIQQNIRLLLNGYLHPLIADCLCFISSFLLSAIFELVYGNCDFKMCFFREFQDREKVDFLLLDKLFSEHSFTELNIL